MDALVSILQKAALTLSGLRKRMSNKARPPFDAINTSVSPLIASTTNGIGSFAPHFMEPILTGEERHLVDSFSDLYYSKLDSGRGLHTIVLSWMGYEMFKCPMDLWIYQEIIVQKRPDLIIEVGTYKGGSTLYLAHMLDFVGKGDVVSIDINPGREFARPQHPRIRYVTGSSTDPAIYNEMAALAQTKDKILVILDGDHRCDHVLEELRLYHKFIKPDDYLIVEDTNINGHPTYRDFGPGPWEAVDLFLSENNDFYPDRSCERFLLTMNPRGYLRRRQNRQGKTLRN
ncbi:CmcI family methyltransferase [Labrys okinawensis]|uniref:CmcI family methyltransferase n=1 Tax=Labrys okinawensis TaxID=346911 RepID=UPI0039BC27DE